MGLIAALFMVGCPSGDDDDDSAPGDDDDSAPGDDDDTVGDDDDSAGGGGDTLEVTGADPCGPIATACWSADDDGNNYLYASNVEDFCTRVDENDALVGSQDYQDAEAALDAAVAAEDGNAACLAMVALNALSGPAWDAMFGPGTCTMAITNEGPMGTDDPVSLSLVYGVDNMGECVLEILGDCSDAYSWDAWLDLEDEAMGLCSHAMTMWAGQGSVELTDEGGDAWRAVGTDLEVDGYSVVNLGATATVTFDFVAQFHE